MPSINVLIVEKNGDIRPLKIKEYSEQDLFKKAGFKSAEGFKQQTSWAVEVEGVQYKVLLFAKANGKPGSENKYDFPPPVDSTLFFGACVLVGVRDKEPADLSVDQWSKFYEFLFGGFEDLHSDDEEEEELDTDDEIAAMEEQLEQQTGKPVTIQTTKQGYIKDDFIVDDDEVEEELDLVSESSESVKPKKKTRAKKNSDVSIETKPKQRRQRKSKKQMQEQQMEEMETVNKGNEYLDCTSELTYEEYVK